MLPGLARSKQASRSGPHLHQWDVGQGLGSRALGLGSGCWVQGLGLGFRVWVIQVSLPYPKMLRQKNHMEIIESIFGA